MNKKRGKRGLSQLITTVLLIALILVAIAGIWLVVNNFILKGSGEISLSKITVDLNLKSAVVDYDTGIATIRVKRELGKGNLIGIKIIVEDQKTSEVFDERFVRFEELAEKTFEIDLKTEGTDLILHQVEKLSIAPIILLESGEESIGRVSDEASNLNKGIDQVEEDEEPENEICSTSLDCGTDYWIEDSEICNAGNDQVLQYKRVYTCTLGFCNSDLEALPKEDCLDGTVCYDGACVNEQESCNLPIDCGEDTYVGSLKCNLYETSVVQDYKAYTCAAGICDTAVTEKIIQECVEEEICFQGECFIPLECTQNADCDLGEICVEGICEIELALNTGTINSIWPFNIGEYFDSTSLPKSADKYTGSFIIFPGSSESRCLLILDHVYPENLEDNAYIKLNQLQTNITSGDNYEIWETSYICSTL